MERPRIFTSKYPGRCFKDDCRKPVSVGDLIWFVPGTEKEVYHYDCRYPVSGSWSPYEAGQDGYLFIDLETGGLDPEKDAIVQLSAIATTNNLLILSTFDRLIKPPENLELGEIAIKTHGKTREMLANQPSEAEVCAEFAAWCKQFPNFRAAGYNFAVFDTFFMAELIGRNNLVLTNDHLLYIEPCYDLLFEAKAKLKDKTENHKLVTVAEYFGLNNAGAHNSLIDLFLTVQSARNLQKIA